MGKGNGKMAIKKKERIGFDFDNTLTKLPLPFSFLNRVFNSTQTPKFLYRLYWKTAIRLPIFLDLDRLETIRVWAEEFDMYIVTGRWGGERMIAELLASYGFDEVFKGVYAPNHPPKASTQIFKEEYCRMLDLSWYFEDNHYTVYYLREKGIRALKV